LAENRSGKGNFLRLAAATALVVLSACAYRKPVDLISPDFSARTPRSVAVLPFDSLSTDLDATPLVRPIIYQRMIYKGYNCAPPDQVDAALKAKGAMVSHDVYMFTAQELGEMLSVDAVVYGTVTDFTKHYAVIYADIIVGLKLQMVDTATGEVLWESRHLATENTALDTLLLALQFDEPEKALAAAAAYNVAFAALTAFRPYAETAAAKSLASLPPGPQGQSIYPWDASRSTWEGDQVIILMEHEPVIRTYSPHQRSRRK